MRIVLVCSGDDYDEDDDEEEDILFIGTRRPCSVKSAVMKRCDSLFFLNTI